MYVTYVEYEGYRMPEIQKQKVEKLQRDGFIIVRDFNDHSLEMCRGCHFRRVAKDGSDEQVHSRFGL